MRLIFLDVDGVLNDHAKLPGSPYCGVKSECMAQLNRILSARRSARIVLISAWRYMCFSEMTHKGFEYMLYTHGLVPRDPQGCRELWIVGWTAQDKSEDESRSDQISAWLNDHAFWQGGYYLCTLEETARQRPAGNFAEPEPVSSFVVIDDLESAYWDARRHVRTDGRAGLTAQDADRAIEILGVPWE